MILGHEVRENIQLNRVRYRHQVSLAYGGFVVSSLGPASRCRCYLLAPVRTAAATALPLFILVGSYTYSMHTCLYDAMKR